MAVSKSNSRSEPTSSRIEPMISASRGPVRLMTRGRDGRRQHADAGHWQQQHAGHAWRVLARLLQPQWQAVEDGVEDHVDGRELGIHLHQRLDFAAWPTR